MNFNLYLFGSNMGAYNQYPDDYTSSILSSACADDKSSQAVILRKHDLMYYMYSENLGNDNTLGICLVFNKAFIKHISKLFNFLRQIIESTLLKEGKIIHYNSQGDIEFVNNNFSEDSKSYEYIKTLINSKLDSDNNYFGVTELTSTYNGVNNYEVVDGDTANSEILKLQQKFNKIIINYKIGIENDLTKKVIVGLQAQIEQLSSTITEKDSLISTLEKTKKQYKKVLFLLFIVLCAFAGLGFLYSTLDKTERHLEKTTADLNIATDSIGSLNKTVNERQKTIKSLNNEVRDERMQKESFQSTLNTIDSNYPFIVTSSEVDPKHFKFDYYCPVEKEITVTLKAINDKNSEVVSSTHTLTFYKGGGSKTLDFSRTLNNQSNYRNTQYYYVVLMYKGKIIAGQYW